MLDLDNGVDHGQTALIATQQFNEEALSRALASRTHHYAILWREGTSVYMTTFTGTATSRIDYMASGLKIDVDTGQWAAGYWDDNSLRWAVCGSSSELKERLTTLPQIR